MSDSIILYTYSYVATMSILIRDGSACISTAHQDDLEFLRRLDSVAVPA